MPNVNENYVSYLLQFRSVLRDDGPNWNVSVRSATTGELQRFPNLDALIQFLRDEFGIGEKTTTLSQSTAQETRTRAPTEPSA